jgi:hypothetical protein
LSTPGWASLVGKESSATGPISLLGLDPKIPCRSGRFSKHRSVYLPVLRDRLPDVLDLFDFAEPSLVTGDRETTNVPCPGPVFDEQFVRAGVPCIRRALAKEV